MSSPPQRPIIVLEDDHELCEAQVQALVSVLENVKRAKAYDMLPRTVQDGVAWAIRTRGIEV